MAQEKTKAFVNEKVHEIEIEGSGLKGTVTLPIIMTGNQLALYIQSTRKNVELAEKAEEENYTGELVARELTTWNNIHHLVLAIDFPYVTMDNFKDGGKRPWPALTFQIYDKAKPVIDAALNVKKLES
ncbi:MAG: hypothetical protein DRI46_08365 [Chloroflexi bacterium]|nr:MAG: hypothetical protein DRI46_08365 [Chloroflexota bacterium]